MTRIQQESHEIKCSIFSRLEGLGRVERISKKIAREMDLSRDQQHNLAIAVTETVVNAIVHGNKRDPRKKVHIVFRVEKDRVSFSVRDEGKGFDPNQLSDPLDPENIMKENGRGIFILKKLMDEVTYSFTPEGTTVHVIMEKKDKNR